MISYFGFNFDRKSTYRFKGKKFWSKRSRTTEFYLTALDTLGGFPMENESQISKLIKYSLAIFIL